MATGEIISLKKTPLLTSSNILLPASKSESNRSLIIAALAGGDADLDNLSEARDTQIMQSLLEKKDGEWDARDAGTTFRFLTAYAALTQDSRIITGTPRMLQRPIGILVEALRELGADISYLGQEGYPPLEIKKLSNQKSSLLKVRGDISSQYISALMMIAPELKQGLTIEFIGKVGSMPYLKMTSSIMEIFGAHVEWNENSVHIMKGNYRPASFSVESDWSAASYWYAFTSLADQASIELSGLREQSYQGDRAIAEIMENLGVNSEFIPGSVRLTKSTKLVKDLELDFTHCPDLAQTVAVVCAIRGVNCTMTGLESLKIKETDRIMALQNELGKFGAALEENGSSWHLIPPSTGPDWSELIQFETYEDHRMAMAFAPLCTQAEIQINDPSVVNKSYPGFWKDLSQAGIVIS